jgi:hypothetical protein
MLRKSILLCAMLLAFHATAGADKNKKASAEEQAADVPKPGPLCIKDKTLGEVARQLADLQHIPPSPELIRLARDAGVDANPIYAKFGVTGEFDSFKSWLVDLNETADAPLICGRARSGERIVLVAAVRAGSLTVAGKQSLHAKVIEDFREPYLVIRDSKGTTRSIAVDGGEFGATIMIPV